MFIFVLGGRVLKGNLNKKYFNFYIFFSKLSVVFFWLINIKLTLLLFIIKKLAEASAKIN